MNSAGLVSEVDAFGEYEMMSMVQRKLGRSAELKTLMTKIFTNFVCCTYVLLVDCRLTQTKPMMWTGLNEIVSHKNEQLQLVRKKRKTLHWRNVLLFSLASTILNSLSTIIHYLHRPPVIKHTASNSFHDFCNFIHDLIIIFYFFLTTPTSAARKTRPLSI